MNNWKNIHGLLWPSSHLPRINSGNCLGPFSWLLLSTDRHAVIYTIHVPPPFFTPTSDTLLDIWGLVSVIVALAQLLQLFGGFCHTWASFLLGSCPHLSLTCEGVTEQKGQSLSLPVWFMLTARLK